MSEQEHYAYSELTDTWYLIHDCEEAGDGKIVAKGKTEVDRQEVPEAERERIQERLTGLGEETDQ